MSRAIQIGLYAEGDAADGWIRVLRQDRLPWERVDGPTQPIILFDGVLPAWCEDFIEDGGVAIVTAAPRHEALLGSSTTATLTRFRPPGRDIEAMLPCLARVFEGDGEGEVRLHENRKARGGRLADIHPAVLTRQHGRGWLVYTGLPLAAHLMAEGDSLRSFSSASALTERVASVDKADLADTMTAMIGTAFARLGLPLVRVARYPRAARSVFLFRVDVDGTFGSNCRAIADIAQAHGIAGSFYFNASLCRTNGGDLSRDWLAAHEIGNHADVHDLFDSVEENSANLAAGLDWIEQTLGVRPSGYVAPRGLWNRALDRAMAELGQVYSSDFGLAIDALPFFTSAGVLQIPVHPFSPERFTICEEDAGRGPPGSQAVLHHYLGALHRQVALRRPTHLYGHPEVLGRMAETVLPTLFDAVARLDLPTMTVADFAAWWRKRDCSDVSLSIEDDGVLTIETTADLLEAYAEAPGRVILEGCTHDLPPGCWTMLRPNREAFR